MLHLPRFQMRKLNEVTSLRREKTIWASYSACPTPETLHMPSCREHSGHVRKDRAPPGTDTLTSFTRCSMGCSHSVFTSQWLSKKVRTPAAATSAPRTRDRISPATAVDRHCAEAEPVGSAIPQTQGSLPLRAELSSELLGFNFVLLFVWFFFF